MGTTFFDFDGAEIDPATEIPFGNNSEKSGTRTPPFISMEEEEKALFSEEILPALFDPRKADEAADQAAENRLQRLGICKADETPDKEWALIKKFAYDYIDASDKIPAPCYSLSHDHVKFAPANNLFAIGAHKKGGKTTAISIIISSLYGCHDFGIWREDDSAPIILYFDTEQDKADTFIMWRRIAYKCNWDANKSNAHLRIINLRSHRPAERLEMILACINLHRPNHVFIDGIKDICQDFNSQEESTELIEILAQSATKYQCGIWCVLHLNPNDEKMRGHLGTELENKAADIFYTSKDNDHFVLRHEASRHQEIDDILFRIENPEGLPFGIPVPYTKDIQGGKFTSIEKSTKDERMQSTFAKIFADNRARNYEQLKIEIMQETGLAARTAKGWVSEATTKGIIKRWPNGVYNLAATCADNKETEDNKSNAQDLFNNTTY